MPETRVVIFKEDDGTVPLTEWTDELMPEKALAKCLKIIELLRQHGFDIRRPHADVLRDEIHELRTHLGTVQYRILYFYHDKVAVLSHGFVKKKAKVADVEIDLAISRKMKFRKNPERHSFEE
jgi:phage-related protein